MIEVRTTPPTDHDRPLHPDDARRIVLARARPMPVEMVPLDSATFRSLAEPIIAQGDSPPFPAATMDGFAVVADDGSPWRELIGDQTAGYVADLEVTVGTAVRITTGAPVPAGADAVVPVEATRIVDDHVVIDGPTISSGQYIRPIGADLARGEEVLPTGTRLEPAAIGLLASLGAVPVPVRRRPRVGILSTGNELVEPEAEPAAGQIRDANRFALRAAVAEAGADVVWSGHATDDRNALRSLLIDLIGRCDIVVTSGGVSMGELDLVKVLLGELAEVHFRRVFMKPGKPLHFATSDDCLIFGLPGNPVSALVSFELFVRPALGKMLGLRDSDRPRVRVLPIDPITPGDRIEYQRARVVVGADGRLRAAVTGGQASSRLASFVGANALLIVPPSPADRELAPGTELDALLLGAPFGEH